MATKKTTDDRDVSRFVKKSEPAVVTGYDKDGRTTTILKQMVAQTRTVGNQTIYSVLRAKGGPNAAQLWNPTAPFYNPSDLKKKYLGQPMYGFTDVNKACFDWFIKFLQSKNPMFYKKAEGALRG